MEYTYFPMPTDDELTALTADGEAQLDEKIAGSEKQMTARQMAFAHEYVADFNATGAAMRAGYKKDGASSAARRLMNNPQVRDLIEQLKVDRFARCMVSSDQVISQLIRIGFSDVRQIFTSGGACKRIEDLDPNTAAAIEAVKVTRRPTSEKDDDDQIVYEDVVEYKMAPKRPALELLAKHLNLVADGSRTASVTVNNNGDGDTKVVVIPAKADMPDDIGNRVPVYELDQSQNPIIPDE